MVIAFVLCIPLVIILVDPAIDYIHIENDGLRRLLGAGSVALLLCPAAFWDWKTGSYALQKPAAAERKPE